MRKLLFPVVVAGLVVAVMAAGCKRDDDNDKKPPRGGCKGSDGSFFPAGSPCGSPTDSACTSPDTCDDKGVCLGNNEPTSTLCRRASGTCYHDAYCDGKGICPANAPKPQGTSCGAGEDNPCTRSTCDGQGLCIHEKMPATLLCAPAPNDCMEDSYCDGQGSCPPNRSVERGAVCGEETENPCLLQRCDGHGVCRQSYARDDTQCRQASNDCHRDAYCDGMGQCPDNLLKEEGTLCDDGDTLCMTFRCDDEGLCQGEPKPDTTLCREGANECQFDAFCDGEGQCPEAYQPEGHPCGDSSVGVCTQADTCDGQGQCVPNHEPTTTVCRSAQGDCYQEARCDGEGTCPPNPYQPAGELCGHGEQNPCALWSCNGEGQCAVSHMPNTTVCRPSSGECDVEERCDGHGSCPSDVTKPFGTSCGSVSRDICDGEGSCFRDYEWALWPVPPISPRTEDGVVGDHQVKDNVTGLHWQRVPHVEGLSWQEAVEYCDVLELADHDNWRLPTVIELLSIVDYGNENVAINTDLFEDTLPDLFWTSSLHAGYQNTAWTVCFWIGQMEGRHWEEQAKVRCVR